MAMTVRCTDFRDEARLLANFRGACFMRKREQLSVPLDAELREFVERALSLEHRTARSNF
jgi:hypothetical protein